MNDEHIPQWVDKKRTARALAKAILELGRADFRTRGAGINQNLREIQCQLSEKMDQLGYEFARTDSPLVRMIRLDNDKKNGKLTP